MAALRQSNFRLEEEILEGLEVVRERDGVPVSEQVRRALLAWLESKGVAVQKAPRQRVSPRRRG